MFIHFESFSAERRFADLCEAVRHCTLCPRLCSHQKVLSNHNGNIHSKVVFVAEAPGRLGADRTCIPLHGDKTGDNFDNLLDTIAWKRNEIFITNAVLCNPREDNGNNGTPTPDELANCSAFLEMTIELIQPEVVVSLGTLALKALGYIAPHGLTLKTHIAQLIPWSGRMLVPLYHPGPRALINRSLPRQRADSIELAKHVHPIRGLINKPSQPFH